MVKYIISRTSEYRDNISPVKGAVLVTLKKYRDIRGFSNKDEWLNRWPQDADKALKWGVTKKGDPFRIINGSHITFWIIDVNDLRRFSKKYGQIILDFRETGYIGYENLMRLEIYDEYRE